MKKLRLRWLVALAWAIVFAIYLIILCNVVKFGQAFYISIAFTAAAFVITEATLILRGIDERKLITEYPLYAALTIYCLIELISGFVFSALDLSSFGWVFYPQLILLLIFAAAILLLYSYGRRIENKGAEIRALKANLNALLAEISHIMSACTQPECLAELDKLYEKIRFSDPVGTPESAQAENEIAEKIGALRLTDLNDAVGVCSAVKDIMRLIDRRNALVKDNK